MILRPAAVDFISYITERLFPRGKNSDLQVFFARIFLAELGFYSFWRSREAPKRPISSANQLESQNINSNVKISA